MFEFESHSQLNFYISSTFKAKAFISCHINFLNLIFWFDYERIAEFRDIYGIYFELGFLDTESWPKWLSNPQPLFSRPLTA